MAELSKYLSYPQYSALTVWTVMVVGDQKE